MYFFKEVTPWKVLFASIKFDSRAQKRFLQRGQEELFDVENHL